MILAKPEGQVCSFEPCVAPMESAVTVSMSPPMVHGMQTSRPSTHMTSELVLETGPAVTKARLSFVQMCRRMSLHEMMSPGHGDSCHCERNHGSGRGMGKDMTLSSLLGIGFYGLCHCSASRTPLLNRALALQQQFFRPSSSLFQG